MSTQGRDAFHGVFRRQLLDDGRCRVTRHESAPAAIPDPLTGRALRIATVEAGAAAICPLCTERAEGGFVSFVADMRLAYACPACLQLVWLKGI